MDRSYKEACLTLLCGVDRALERLEVQDHDAAVRILRDARHKVSGESHQETIYFK